MDPGFPPVVSVVNESIVNISWSLFEANPRGWVKLCHAVELIRQLPKSDSSRAPRSRIDIGLLEGDGGDAVGRCDLHVEGY